MITPEQDLGKNQDDIQASRTISRICLFHPPYVESPGGGDSSLRVRLGNNVAFRAFFLQ
jgi:hypothetical protein